VSESGLSVGLPELRQEVGFYLGFGRGVDKAWSASQLAEIDVVVQSGVRRVYYPPAISAGVVGYEWSWLRPNESFQIFKPYATGTVTVVSGIVTLLGGIFPANSAGAYFAASGQSSVEIASRDSDTQITLSDLTITATAGSAYQVSYPVYDLPDNFGRMVGTFHYPEVAYRHTISVIPASRLLDMRAYSNLSDDPIYCATRYKSDDGSGGQRQEVLFFPTPNKDWTLSYEYEAYNGALTTAFPYPLGGMQLAEVYLESCLSVAESRINDEIGIHTQQFTALLTDAVMRDRKRGAQRYGQMGNMEKSWQIPFRRGWVGPPYPITYHNELI
jgi:hypothetical protein